MKKIMVVDNDRIMLRLMTRLLEKEGHQVATAEDGLQALDMLMDYTPDVIIVDLIMPNIDGKTLCKIIRNMHKLKDAYLIILSAIAAEEKINIAQLGVNACIAKGPFNETAKHVLAVLDQPVLSSSQCLTEEVIGINSVYPRGITEELLSTKRHFEMVLETITEGILEINSNGRIIYANSTALSLIDIPEENLLGTYFFELFAEDDRKRVTDLMEKANGRALKIFEDDLVCLNRYPVLLDILPLKAGGFASIIILNDLSEQKRTEAAFRKTNKFLKNILDSSSSVSIVSTDLEQNILFWNKGAENIFGYKAEEVVDRQKIDILYHEDEKKRVDDEIRPLIMKDKKSASFEIREVTKDGRILWMNLNLSPRFDEKGHVIGILGVGEDVSKRKRAEEALRESEERLKTILDSIKAGIVVINVDTHKIVDANPAAIQMIGASKEQVIGAVCHKYICSAEKGACPITDLGQKVDNSERILLKANGAEVPILKTVSRILIKGKEYLLESFIDITEKKRLESQLLQAQKMEAIGTLAGGIAHDFNNILMAIIGYGEIMDLFDLAEDDPIRASLDQILNAAYRAKDLVQHILTFSHQTEQEKKPLLLSAIVKEALKFLKASLPATIEIRPNIASALSPILADATQMHQVLMNLCTNAAQAMGENQGVLEVTLDEVGLNQDDTSQFPHLKPGTYLKLTVSDTGDGMDAEVMARIFDPFFTTKKHGEGTGMGLSVVHGIVNSHDGAITVESEPGAGSTFRVFLPLLKQDTVKTQTEIIRPPLTKGNESILFVDDEKSIVNLGVQSLERLGYKITGKTSSKEALKIFQSQPGRFNLVITDLTMPDMTGVELAKKLLLIRPDIPIILCTGYSDKITPEKAEAMGIREFIKKPFGPRDLAESVRRVLDQKIDD